MYKRSDPRFRRTLNEISQTIESANESAQANVYSFSHRYLTPCLSSVNECFGACTSSCFSPRDQRTRNRAKSRGRAELSFDFYDDWDEEDEHAGLLGWSNDEFDGYGTTATQPARQRAMSYGARKGKLRRTQTPEEDDPTVIPASSYFGFLGNLTGKFGGKNLRYKPSAAGLQEHPGASRAMPENEPLLEEDEDDERGHPRHRKQNRIRRGTSGSANTVDSLSSRGDIFPSEDELDDAIPLDDEFAMVLERRTTNSAGDEASSGRKGKRPSAGSRLSTRTMSSRSSRTSKQLSRSQSDSSTAKYPGPEPETILSMTELKREEEEAQREEEAEIVRRRNAARRLAAERLDGAQAPMSLEKSLPERPHSVRTDTNDTGQTTPASAPTTPFPPFGNPSAESITDEPEIDPPGQEDRAPEQDFNAAQLPRLS